LRATLFPVLLKFMKLVTNVGAYVVGIALAVFVSGTSVRAGTEQESAAKSTATQKAKAPKERVILVEVTGSRIPQRVVVYGQQVNSASPLYVVQGQELNNTGATSVAGLLSLDPSITVNRRHP
jgi:hypothetical protein